MKVVAVSDTHMRHEEIAVPDGDLLIHAGDFCSFGTVDELEAFSSWFGALSHQHKVVIAGNHERCIQDNPACVSLLPKDCIYLQDAATEIEGVKLYGSPWQPEFENWAFNLPIGEPLRQVWERIPADADILVTHTPPYGILDVIRGGHVGCEELLAAVQRIKPKYNIFGHVHECPGIERRNETTFINVAMCDEHYELRCTPMVFDY